jgi:hypothetical protein
MLTDTLRLPLIVWMRAASPLEIAGVARLGSGARTRHAADAT